MRCCGLAGARKIRRGLLVAVALAVSCREAVTVAPLELDEPGPAVPVAAKAVALADLPDDWPCKGAGLQPSASATDWLLLAGEEQIRFGGREALLVEAGPRGSRLMACWHGAFERTALRLERALDPVATEQIWTFLEQLHAFSLSERQLVRGRPFERKLWLARGGRRHQLLLTHAHSAEGGEPVATLSGETERTALLLGVLLDLRRTYAADARQAPLGPDGSVGAPTELPRKLLLPELAKRATVSLLDRGQLPDQAWEQVLNLAELENREVIEFLLGLLSDDRPWIAGAARSALSLRAGAEDPRQWWQRVGPTFSPQPTAALPTGNQHLTPLAGGAGGLESIEFDTNGELLAHAAAGAATFRYRESDETFVPEVARRPSAPQKADLNAGRGRYQARLERSPDGTKRLALVDAVKQTSHWAPIPPARILRVLASTSGARPGFLVLRDERDPIGDRPAAVEIWWARADGQLARRRFLAESKSSELFRPLAAGGSDGARLLVALELADLEDQRFLVLGWLNLSSPEGPRPELERIFVEPQPRDGRRARGPFFEGEAAVAPGGGRVVLLYDGRAYEWLAPRAVAE